MRPPPKQMQISFGGLFLFLPSSDKAEFLFLVSFWQIQQRRQELEQALALRNT